MKTYPTFTKWLEQMAAEMCGTGAIYDGTKGKDFNWWGCPESAIKPKAEKKKPAKKKK